MTVKIRQYKRGGFEVDIRFTYPDGTPFRRRLKAPVESKSAARRWGEAREAEYLKLPSPVFLRAQEEERKEVPTLREFYPRFLDQYAKANQKKASSTHSMWLILSKHLLPECGDQKIDEIDDADVARIKGKLADRSRNTVNNVLTVLNSILRVAVEWKVIREMPCRIKRLKVATAARRFYEFGEYEALVNAAAEIDLRTLVVVLLGGDAGLRRGEMLGLRWSDVDLRRKQLVIEQAVWRKSVDLPKGGRGRVIPMTDALHDALRRYRHLRGERVLYLDEADHPRTPAGGERTTLPCASHLRKWVRRAQERAGINAARGQLHILRHTFCSHLAMRGAPPKAIQELAGHEDLATTMRYMHLSPHACSNAIALLNTRGGGSGATEGGTFGGILETADSAAVAG